MLLPCPPGRGRECGDEAARPYSQKKNSEGNWLKIAPNCATLSLVLVGGFAVQLARSIRWCVVALLPTLLLVAFLVGVEARVPQMIEPGAVILSEVAWGGTAAGSADEWLELYNTTAAAINLNGWSLTDSSGDLNHTLNGTIPAHGFDLLKRTDDSTVSDTANMNGPTGVSQVLDHVLVSSGWLTAGVCAATQQRRLPLPTLHLPEQQCLARIGS